VQADADRVGEQRADDGDPAGPGIERDDLAVVTEPAAGPIDAVEDVLHGPAGGIEIAVDDDEADPRPERAPVGSPGLGHDDPVAAWAVPVVVVGAAVAWVVVPGVVVVLVEPPVVLEVPVVAVVVSVETIAAVVTSVEVPSCERAATAPNPPTAAMLAMLLPIVRALRRATARSRSAGLRRAAVFMTSR
jgi:hypothetical protein